jgi:hypothetical protein
MAKLLIANCIKINKNQKQMMKKYIKEESISNQLNALNKQKC